MGRFWDGALPYFTETELRCRHCGELKLDLVFAAALVALRFQWGRPLTPTSVCRCFDHNQAVGGHPRSLHLTQNPVHRTAGTAAADIFWGDWSLPRQLEFAQLAYKLGFSVGLHRTFCHVDARALLDIGLKQSVFTYDKWDKSRFQEAEVWEIRT